jgi:hypothetical protein
MRSWLSSGPAVRGRRVRTRKLRENKLAVGPPACKGVLQHAEKGQSCSGIVTAEAQILNQTLLVAHAPFARGDIPVGLREMTFFFGAVHWPVLLRPIFLPRLSRSGCGTLERNACEWVLSVTFHCGADE